MGEKGTEAIEKLPQGYHIDPAKTPAGEPSFVAHPDGPRPGLPLAWDPAKRVWTPPGFVPDPSDPDRIFNKTSGQNGVWDDKAKQWVDSKTGKPLTYEQ